jgi:hypothetical protein
VLRSQRVRRHRHFALYGRHHQGLDTSRNLEEIAARLWGFLWGRWWEGGVYPRENTCNRATARASKWDCLVGESAFRLLPSPLLGGVLLELLRQREKLEPLGQGFAQH